VEFKSGAPSPVHQAQLDVYVAAAKAMFAASEVTGQLLYPT
jgi:hypothetical protein